MKKIYYMNPNGSLEVVFSTEVDHSRVVVLICKVNELGLIVG